MRTVADLLDRAGGPDHVATVCGVTADAVRKWRERGAVPGRHWHALAEAAGVTLGLVAELAAPAPERPESPLPPETTAVLVLADGTVFPGRGFGAPATTVGEVCFNTAMTGYQEVLTDPSYAGQIITFTFPHIGNIGTNSEDVEALTPAARGLVVRHDVTEPANWRAQKHLHDWLLSHGVPGIAGLDTRALTVRIRDGGAPTGVLCHAPDGRFDLDALRAQAKAWPGLEGMDLARSVSCTQAYGWNETRWLWPSGYGRQAAPRLHVIAIDYGAKRNILRCLAEVGCGVTVLPASASAEDVLRHRPDGVFLSNGPGDPAATAKYAVPTIQGVLAAGVPLFGICLGHQLLALALGAKTKKLARGHRGANHPVKDLSTGKVEITSQNHGFAVMPESLPDDVVVTHTSLFDGTNEGIASSRFKAFSVQYHPEASPGPTDSFYLFRRFVQMIERKQAA
jgi:carbamoyl-phosphate synthase small subunit